MFSNRIVQAAISDIAVAPGERAGSRYLPEPITELAQLIANSQWVCPILVNQETNIIIAGRRRYTAVSLLHAIVNGKLPEFIKQLCDAGLPWQKADPIAISTQLNPISTCQVDSWNNWSKIPSQLGSNFTEAELKTYELIENAGRQDISWQEKAKAIYTIHALSLKDNPEWNNAKTGNLVGLDHSTVARNLKAWRFMEDDPSDKIKLIISESPTLNSALQALTRFTSRRQDEIVSLSTSTSKTSSVSLSDKPGPTPGKPRPDYSAELDSYDEEFDDGPTLPSPWEDEDTQTAPPFGERLLTCADFHEWAAAYSGSPFNFIHCDFPYGINFNTGDQTSNVQNKLAGDYDDSPEVYWDLLDTLVQHRDSLIADSAHVMFWFSQNLRRETEDFFRTHFPDATLNPFLMIWHCSDLDGTVPDPQRYGRRTYETAMLLTFGDRHIVSPKALSFSSPRDSKTRHHRSQKPLPVLTHFMSMFVDDASSVLDPTAGSGTSLLTAHQLGASRIQGIEKEEETYSTAVNFLNQRESAISL